MKLTIKAKLLPTSEQKESLVKTMEIFNDACNYISKIAWEKKKFGQVGLHHLCYRHVRDIYSLSAQLTVRAIGKVKESYRINKKVFHKFRKHSALVYDERILSFRGLDKVSILSIEGRFKIPIVIGNYAKLTRRMLRGQADLVIHKGDLYLCLCVDIPENTPYEPKGVLGVDMGIVNIAVTSDGEFYTGEKINEMRKKSNNFKRKLQKRGSKNSKRHLKKYSGKERRFKRLINHTISKRIVNIAFKTQRAVALENLKGFRRTVRKAQREIFGKWAFGELRKFIEYKAKLKGVPIVPVNPEYTSQICSSCGYVSKSNRKSQSLFSCTSCGKKLNADLNSAINIAQLAASKPTILNLSPCSMLNHSCPGTESPVL